MKKICFIFAVFAALALIVSCGGSSKNENKTETPDPGETVTDDDPSDTTSDSGDSASDDDRADTVSDDENTDTAPEQNDGDTTPEQNDDADSGDPQPDNDSDGDSSDSGDSMPDDEADTEPDDPCDPNPCAEVSHSTGDCAASGDTFSCGCMENYGWENGGCKPLFPECGAANTFPCIDSATGLAWSGLNEEELSQGVAATYCEDMGEGWRLPNIDELRTLIQNCSSTIADAACKVTDPDCLTGNCANKACKGCDADLNGIYSKFGDNDSLWSSSVQSDNTDNGWVAGFKYANITGEYNKFKLGVRCVKGTYQHAAGACSPNPCYTIKYSTGACIPEGSGYKCECDTNTTWDGSDCRMTECFTSLTTPCHDSLTGLMWSARTISLQTLSDAESYCENLTEGGYTDWKLPDIDQLRSLVKNCSVSETGGGCKLSLEDNCVTSSCIGTTCNSTCDYDGSGKYSKFGDSAIFWSSTNSDNATSYWVINFYSAAFVNNGQDSGGNEYGARCVR